MSGIRGMDIDKVGGENLYISGMYALRGREALREVGITHIVSVLRLPLDRTLFKGYEHKVIEVDDSIDENLLAHFTDSNEFISKALQSGGVVLIHCAMGVSRSATILAAYLMATRRINSDFAIGLIQRSRGIVDPNGGFKQQLELYHEMEYTTAIEDHPLYQRWVYIQDVKKSNAAGRAPGRVHFQDAENEIGEITQMKEGETAAEKGEIELRCKMCRCTLATSSSLTPHIPRPTYPRTLSTPHQCAHHFIEPLLWMKAELSKGEISGRLECPKCKAKVGSYAWQGLKCSCGDWVVPGISLARGKVDEIRKPPTKS